MYPLAELLADVRRGIWRELTAGQVAIDTYRQGLQQAHVVTLSKLLREPPALETGARGDSRREPGAEPQFSAYERGVLAAESRELLAEITAAIPRAADRTTKAHLQNMMAQLGGL
ncbi:MAG: hypothetical protein ACREL3_10060 [Gemmatimonadales bacterium]